MQAVLAASPTLVVHLDSDETFVMHYPGTLDMDVRIHTATIHPDHIHLSGQRVAKSGHLNGHLGLTIYDENTTEGLPDNFRAVLAAARLEVANATLRIRTMSDGVQRRLVVVMHRPKPVPLEDDQP